MFKIFESGQSKLGATKSILELVKGASAIACCTHAGIPAPADVNGSQPAGA
jgi:lactam utilization protein B